MRKSGLFLGVSAIGLAAAISMASAPACVATGTCAAQSFKYDPINTPATFQGHLIDDYTWESTPLGCTDTRDAADECARGGAWLDVPGEGNYLMQLVDWQTKAKLKGRIYAVYVYLGTSAHPDIDGTRATMGSGNLAEWTILKGPNADGVLVDYDPQTLYVQNDTCGEYFMRVEVHAEPTPPTPDAGSDASGVDSSIDAPAD